MSTKTTELSIAHYIDTSIVVKLLTPEAESDKLEKYITDNPSYEFYITEFTFYETLSVLKQKWKKRKEIDETDYHMAVDKLSVYLEEDETIQIDSDFRLDRYKVIYDVKGLIDKYSKYSFDYSDALQIYTVMHGKRSGQCAEFTTVFVTADAKLAKAAKSEGLRVWNPVKESHPPLWGA